VYCSLRWWRFLFTAAGGRAFFEKQAASSSRMQRLPAEDREHTIDKEIQFAPIVKYFKSVVVPFIYALIVTAVMMGVFNLSGAAKVNFKRSLGIALRMPGYRGWFMEY
jgi:hypothetical protein